MDFTHRRFAETAARARDVFLPVVNAAREKIFVAMGSGKAEMTAKILKDAPRDGSVPAALVKGNVRWIVDDAAAALLSE